MLQANRPYNLLNMEFRDVMVPLNQTNQQRQDSTANILNTQLYTFITTFGKIQNSFKNRKNVDRNIKTLNMIMTNSMIYGLAVLNL
jgi:hypothetical protein